MFRILLVLVALFSSVSAFADCNEYALQGEWTVFYSNNAFPTSVLMPDRKINISYQEASDQYTVSFTDPLWKAWQGGWSHECVGGQTVLIGAIALRLGISLLVIEIGRVVDVSDLLARSSGVVKLEQINIQFPELLAVNELGKTFEALGKSGYVASHPGHSHADK